MASISKHANGRWKARYYDADGKQRARNFVRKTDARAWLDEITASIVTGTYVAPNAGKITFRAYAEHWREIQVHKQSTREQVAHIFHRHVYPVLGERAMASILPSDIQTLVRRLEVGGNDRRPLAPSTIGTIHSHVSSVFKSAVRDRKIATNPAEGTKLPQAEKDDLVPLTLAQVVELEVAVPADLTALVTLAAGTGMRPGECLGLTVDRLDMLRREVKVDRQLLTRPGQVVEFGAPKTPSSKRIIPMPLTVVDALAAHLAAYDVGRDGLVFHLDGEGYTRQRFGHLWRPAVYRAKGVPRGTRCHDLRHHYASLLIFHGTDVKTLQKRLGHKSAMETLDTYSHLWPDSDDRTREAIDQARAAFQQEVAQ